jgi:hypothetical protein
VIAAVRDHVQKDLFACHAALVAVGEGEVQHARERRLAQAAHVVEVPRVSRRHVRTKLLERRRRLGVRRIEGLRRVAQARLEEAVDDMDVIERADAGVQRLGMLRRQSRQQREQLGVGPGLVAEQRLEGGE